MTTNSRTWRWGPLLALTVGALSSLHCIDLPKKSFSCSTDEDCSELRGPGGEPYVCVSEGFCEVPGSSDGGDSQDAGTDAGTDGGSNTGSDGGCTQPSVAPTCSTSNWCWDNPLSEGLALFTVRGRSETDVWAVGERGVALHWDGTCWARNPPSSTQPLRAAWPAAGRTWWFGGGGGMLHRWDGSAWMSQTLAESSTLYDIEGASGTSAVAVGQTGALYAFNGTQWSPPSWDAGTNPAPDLLAVWPVSNTEAWAVGRNATLVHGVDGGWVTVNKSGSVDLVAVAAGADAGTAYAVGKGTLFTYANSAWTVSSLPAGATTSTPLNGVWTTAGTTRIVGPGSTLYVLGKTAEASGTPQGLNSIWGNSDAALWAVGASGTIVRRGATQWAEVPGGVTRNVNALWGTDALNLWAAGDNDLIMGRQNLGWSPVAPPEAGSFTALWGSGALLLVAENNVATGGSGSKIHVLQNGQWVTPSSTFTSVVNGLWGTGAAPVWAVGNSGFLRRRDDTGSWVNEGGTLTPMGSTQLNAVWGSSATDVWAVGNGGTVFHRDITGNWTSQKPPSASADLLGVWNSGPRDVWVVGVGGVAYHYDGTSWTSFSTGVAQTLRAIAGQASNAVWAVGDNGSLTFWNGQNWTAQVSGVSDNLRTVWVTPGNVWVGGANGTVLRLQP
ncbi:WD40/YVTN/BNR-like repeat-containing protein [Archangium sp.]|uniref:WD40/YVTN/BNR-like repeat-containing protein n=1 Tax=Archangium sp. TaxID=1872627 RepID=UPI003899F981